jgi:hypothetical protein
MKNLLLVTSLLLLINPPAYPHIEVKLVKLSGFSVSEAARFVRIADGVEQVVNSPEFRAMVLDWYHKGEKRFVDTTDTPAEVLAKITSRDWALDYELKSRLWKTSTIGFTKASWTKIVLYRDKFHNLDDAEIARNICHEYGGHKLGRYGHSSRPTPQRPFSAPYGLGFICWKLFKNK